MEDAEYDSKYKSYTTQVEKVLKQFESPRGWADLCAYLSKLKRILQSNAKYQLIPKKLLIAKRLSQCLHHALPSGVHLKTLDVYVLIFKRIGMERLSRDLSIYSMGLFPLVGHSAMSVRPKLLEIFDTYYIPLGANLVPCLHGFILSLLAGLEEGSEHFDSVVALLGKLKQATGRPLFYGSLWRAVISSPSIRYQGSLYVLMQITKRKRVGKAMLGDNRETLITALCMGLEDSNILTQRNFLDFILYACPLNSTEFCLSDCIRLIKSALCVLLRRDMSLNRRLYGWLEGHNSEHDTEQQRISMTSQELKTIVELANANGEDEKGKLAISGEEEGEKGETPTDLTPRAVRKALMHDSEVTIIPNGSPYDNISLPVDEIVPPDMDSVKKEMEQPTNASCDNHHVTLLSPEPSCVTAETSVATQATSVLSQGTSVITQDTSRFPSDASYENGEFSGISEEPSKVADMSHTYRVLPPEKDSESDSVLIKNEIGKTLDDSPDSPSIDRSISQDIEEVRAVFFQKHGRPLMVRCLRELLEFESSNKTVLLEPYRIINSLMDRQDFGTAIIEDLLLDIMRALYRNCVNISVTVTPSHASQLKLHNSNTAKELIKAGNMLFNTFEPKHLWDWVAGYLNDQTEKKTPVVKGSIFTPSADPQFDEVLMFIDFLLNVISCDYNSSLQSTYLPSVLQSVVTYLNVHVLELDMTVLGHAIETCSNLLSKSQPVTYSTPNTTKTSNSELVEASKSTEEVREVNEKKKKKKNDNIEMDEISVKYASSDEENYGDKSYTEESSVYKTQDSISKTITIYQDFLHKLLDSRVLPSYTPDTPISRGLSTVLPASLRLLLDFACFPIFCAAPLSSTSQRGSDSKFLLTDGVVQPSETNIKLPYWLTSVIKCCELISWEEVVISSIKTLSVLIGLTLTIAEERNAGRKSLEGSVSVMLLPMLSEVQLQFIQSHTNQFKDLIRSLWTYLAARYAHLHRRVVKLLWKLHHLAPSSNIAEDVFGEMISSPIMSVRHEGLRRFTVFWHLSSKLSDNCKEWNKLQVSGKDLGRTTLVLLECLNGSDYQSRLLSKAWISHCFHNNDLNRIIDPLLIQLLHPSSARRLTSTPLSQEALPAPSIAENRLQPPPLSSVFSFEDSNVGVADEDAHSLNTRIKMSVFSDCSDEKSEYSTAESTEDPSTLAELKRSGGEETRKRTDCQHELFYSQEYDTHRSRYIWLVILSMLQSDPTPFLRSCNNTKFNATSKYLSQEVYELFHKHRMCIRDELFSDPFFMTQSVTTEVARDMKSSIAERLRKISKSYLELLATVCLWYIRSQYERKDISENVFASNCEVRLVAVEFLSYLIRYCIELPSELRTIATETLFDKCHLQETVLYVLQRSIVAHTEAAYIVREDIEMLEWTKSFQSELLVLIKHILDLERVVNWGNCSGLGEALSEYEFDYKYVNYYMNCEDTHITKVSMTSGDEETSNNPKYIHFIPTIGQPLFIHSVLIALTTRRVTFLHRRWLDIISSNLDYKSPLLKKLSEVIVSQIVNNLLQLSKEYHYGNKLNPVLGCVPVNQVVLLLESLTTVVHFVLVHAPSAPTSSTSTSKSGFLEFFNFSGEDAGTAGSPGMEHVNQAKYHMLQYVPKCFDTLLDVWINWKMVDTIKTENLYPWGETNDVKNLILAFASPLFRKYPARILGFLCEVWHINRRNLIFGRPGHLVSVASKRQMALIDLIMEIKVCTFDVILKNAQKLLSTAASDPKNSREQFGFPFEVELVHLCYEYFKKLKAPTMQKAWPHLVYLLRECTVNASNPPIIMLGLGFLQVYLSQCPKMDDLKAKRELQEMTSKLVDFATEIASKSLTGNTWFGRKTEVLPVYNEVVSVKKESPDSHGSSGSDSDEENYEGEHVYTLQSIYVLNECLSQLIDLVYGSEEKDKAIQILSPLITKISVYIRNHAHHNMPNAKASAALLSSITDYQYCRKAWAKELFDAFMDPDFFIMDPSTLSNWKVIIEHLIAHDNTLFTDLITRVTTATGGLFSSNEVFYQQKARLLRRLSFTIYCCEYNQYSKFISNIQECFVESLKLTQAYQVIREVFLGFRVIVLRMSPATFTPLWPIMLTELYGHLVDLRDMFAKAVETNKILDISEKVLEMYLSVCKLLDLALSLPGDKLPDFTVHNWTFVSDRPQTSHQTDMAFQCLAREIAYLYHDDDISDSQIRRTSNVPFLKSSSIAHIADLKPFFIGLARHGLFGGDAAVSEEASAKLIEQYLDMEYLDLN